MRKGVRNKCVVDSNRNIKTLLGAKNMIVIIVALFDRLDDIYITFSCESADFVASVGEHEHEKQDAAKGTQFRRKCICSLVYQ